MFVFPFNCFSYFLYTHSLSYTQTYTLKIRFLLILDTSFNAFCINNFLKQYERLICTFHTGTIQMNFNKKKQLINHFKAFGFVHFSFCWCQNHIQVKYDIGKYLLNIYYS